MKSILAFFLVWCFILLPFQRTAAAAPPASQGLDLILVTQAHSLTNSLVFQEMFSQALTSFLSLLDPSQDQVGLAGFNTPLPLRLALTNDFDLVRQLATSPPSRPLRSKGLDFGLYSAAALFRASSPPDSTRTRVIILFLTDPTLSPFYSVHQWNRALAQPELANARLVVISVGPNPIQKQALPLPPGSLMFLLQQPHQLKKEMATIALALHRPRIPWVSLSSPASGASVLASDTLTLSSRLYDPSNQVRRLDFFLDATNRIGQSSLPFAPLTWKYLPIGRHSLSVVASTANGATIGSQPVKLQILPGTNVGPPRVDAGPDRTVKGFTTLPLLGAVWSADAQAQTTWKLESGPAPAVFSNPHHTNATVTFKAPGSYCLRLLATHPAGTSSDSVIITVENILSITLDAVPPLLAAPATVTLRARPVTTFGSILSVTLSNAQMGSETAPAPLYTVSWTDLVSGLYSVTATVCNNLGETAVSDPVQFRVNAPPQVLLTAPQPNARFTENTPILLQAGAYDSDGSIAEVSFFADGGQRLATISPVRNLPLRTPDPLNRLRPKYFWTNAPPGSHTVWARAIDDLGLFCATPPVTFTVTRSNQPPRVEAGPPQVVRLPQTEVTLRGFVADDGQLQSPQLLWRVLSGADRVQLTPSNAITPTARFTGPGLYDFSLSAFDGEFTRSNTTRVEVLAANAPPAVFAGTHQVLLSPASSANALKLQPFASIPFPIGIDYHPPSGQLLVSVHYNEDPKRSGKPFNLGLLDARGELTRFSALSNITDEIKLTVVRDGRGGFDVGSVFLGSSQPGEILRISSDGAQIDQPWVTLPGETGLLRGSLTVDQTGLFGGDLLVVTTSGGIWRINAQKSATRLATIPYTFLEGICIIPNDPTLYGPWAGRLLIGAEAAPNGHGGKGLFYSVSTHGLVMPFDLGIQPEDIDLVPSGQSLYAAALLSDSPTTLWSASGIDSRPGDILVTQEEGAFLWRVRWEGTRFDTTRLALMDHFEHLTFAPMIPLSPLSSQETWLRGSVSDDGLPSGAAVVLEWNQVSGPAPITLEAPGLAITRASGFSLPGQYGFRLSGSDSEHTRTSDVLITVVSNSPPSVDAGPDRSVPLALPVLIQGQVLDDDLPSSRLQMEWILVQGPAQPQFSPLTNASITATFLVPGQYQLRLTAYDGEVRVEDDLFLEVLGPSLQLFRDTPAPSTLVGATQVVTALFLDAQKRPLTQWPVEFQSKGTYPDSFSAITDAAGLARWEYVPRIAETIRLTALAQAPPNRFSVQSSPLWMTAEQPLVCGKSVEGSYSNEVLHLLYGTEKSPLLLQLLSTERAVTLSLEDLQGRVLARALGESALEPFQLRHLLPSNGVYRVRVQSDFISRRHGYRLDLLCEEASLPPSLGVVISGRFQTNLAQVTFPIAQQAGPQSIPLLLTNLGAGTLSLSQFQVQGDFSLSPGSPLLLESGSNVILSLSYQARTNSNGLLSFASNDPENNSFNLFLMGRLASSTPPDPPPPAIALTAPADGARFPARTAIPMVVVVRSASPDYQAVIWAQRGVDRRPILSFTSPPPALIWSNPPTGSLTLWAVVRDAFGQTNLSAPLHILVEEPPPSPVARDDEYSFSTRFASTRLEVLANDFSATDLLRIASVQAPAETASITADGLAILFFPADHAVGQQTFSYTVTNTTGQSATARVSVRIFASEELLSIDLVQPSADLTLAAGQSLQLQAQPSTETRVGFFLDDTLLGIAEKPPYIWTWSAPPASLHRLQAAALTSLGDRLVSTVVRHVQVTAMPGDQLPVALLLNWTNQVFPLASGRLWTNAGPRIQEGLFRVSGTAADPDPTDSVSYQLRLFFPDGTLAADVTPPPWNQAHFHAGAVQAGVLGEVDASLLPNGRYDLELSVRGGLGQTITRAPFLLESDLKLGQLSFSEQDLVLPVAGIPLALIRSYNSLHSFEPPGFGWSFSFQDANVTLYDERGERREVATDEPVSVRLGGSRDVTLTLPDGRRTTFLFYLEPGESDCFCARARFLAAPGVFATLEVLGDDSIHFLGNFPSYWQASGPQTPEASYDIPGFILTLPDGTRYVFEREDLGTYFVEIDGPGEVSFVQVYGTPRLRRVLQPSGQRLEISSHSISHYNPAGEKTRSLVLQRDEQERLYAVFDPNHQGTGGIPSGPPILQYRYDNQGNLSEVLRLQNAETYDYATNTFLYEHPRYPHLPTQILDPLGQAMGRFLFYPDGRLQATLDALGQTNQLSYDLAARTQTLYNRRGQPTFLAFDARGNITATTDALGRTIRHTFDARSLMLSETDPLLNTTFYGYDTQGRLTTTTNALLASEHTQLNAAGQPLIHVDYNGNTNYFGYDAAGNLRTSTNALNVVTLLVYDPKGQLIAQLDAQQNWVTNQYDAYSNLTDTRAYDAAGQLLSHASYTYDANGQRLTETTWRTGLNGVETAITSSYTYDPQGRLLTSVDALGNTNQTLYTPTGQIKASIDPKNRLTSYEYNAAHQLLRVTYPDLSTESYGYDAEGFRTHTTNRESRVTITLPDLLGRPWKTILPDLSSTTTHYDEAGRIRHTVDARGFTNTFAYDATGRRLYVTNTLLQVTGFTYDANGNQETVTDANLHATTNRYDALNRLTHRLFHDGSSSDTVYDSLGRRLSETDQNTNTVWFGYDGLGRLTSVTNYADTNALVTRYQYDDAGNLLFQVDALNRTNAYTYDLLGRRLTHTLPLGQSATNFYDSLGNLTNRVDFNGYRTTYHYDDQNRLRYRIPDPRLHEASCVFTYTLLGQRESMQDASGLTQYRYNTRGALEEKATPFGTLYYRYDATGNLTNLYSSNPQGIHLSYTWDELNRLSNVVDAIHGRTEYHYDPVGRLKSYQYPNQVTHTYAYDSLNRLTNLVVTGPGGVLARFGYSFSASGQRRQIAETIGLAPPRFSQQISYAYDGLNRLTNETVQGQAPYTTRYRYDAVGNRLERTSTHPLLPALPTTVDDNDRLASDLSDANGNTRQSGDAIYQYDHENRLTYVKTPTNEVQIVYDGDGNRVAKTVNNLTIHYLVDDLNPTGYAQGLEELTILPGTTNRTVNRINTYGMDLISQEQVQEGHWNTIFYGYDAHDSVRLLTTQEGQISDTYHFDAYGVVLCHLGTNSNNYLYTGEQYELDIGLYYLRARYLNPNSGRFWTIDSSQIAVGDTINQHRYIYCNDNPANRFDPSGLLSFGSFGKEVHKVIQEDFEDKSEFNKSEYSIGRLLGTTTSGRLNQYPDMSHTEPGNKYFFEIKSNNPDEIAKGQRKIALYNLTLNTYEPWRPGNAGDYIYNPPLKGALIDRDVNGAPLPGGKVAIVHPPLGGLIIYTKLDPKQIPNYILRMLANSVTHDSILANMTWEEKSEFANDTIMASELLSNRMAWYQNAIKVGIQTRSVAPAIRAQGAMVNSASSLITLNGKF